MFDELPVAFFDLTFAVFNHHATTRKDGFDFAFVGAATDILLWFNRVNDKIDQKLTFDFMNFYGLSTFGKLTAFFFY